MKRIRGIFERETEREASYEPLEGGSERPDGEPIEGADAFSWTTYSVFLLLGVAMLWAWNMFLAANPYFQRRFERNDNLLRNFQSAIMSVSTVGNLGSMIVLTKLQARANYPRRIATSLVLNIGVFTLLALSTKMFLGVTAGVYFAFLMLMVLSASLAAGLCQNGVFAYVAGFGREEYTQGIMAGQGIAGVLPCIAQIVSVLSVPPSEHADGTPQQSSTSAFAYFLTATVISAAALLAFVSLQRNHSRVHLEHVDVPSDRKPVPLTRLFRKLTWLATAVFLTFVVTMFFPVFTQKILSVRDPASAPRLFQPATFIPLGFLFWNAGDLLGRMGPALPALRLTAYPRILFLFAVARAAFIPLYLLCNVGGTGAAVGSDFFYLVVVQLLFGLSNGYLGSSCMMGFVEWVDPEEAEAAGGFMSLCLVGGLTAGSFMSFFAAQAI
ncbi:nucleoside transporter-domain-containing protein [Boeremia exigua]|uniref:nucleoside transporter-domain-containing protein n=1 Tax=Boeremia exigua TaxID=749465 RepID=UPI001E8D0032|nr:nucleoside transporter-domain-containing protein [Boeremia exigua]KAH6625628.1 nucleoside transporter-domain-containing protein [Boeremia exigua]